jgi:membrane protein implicated in regulation of membrane protease activity
MDSFQMFLEAKYLWLLAGVVMIILEFMLPGFVIVFFGVGAILVGVICWLWTISFNAQLVLFMAISVVLLLAIRKWVKNIFVGYTSSQEAIGELSKEFAGELATVISEIAPDNPGKVEFHGTNWEAESDEPIARGERVKIIGQRSIRLMVKKI